MSEPSKPLAVVQTCYMVRDLETSCARLNRLYGIGPFVGGSRSELHQHLHFGRQAPPILLRSVFAQSGDLNLEIVQLLSDSPNAFRDMYPSGGDGLHHVAVFCDDYHAERNRFISLGYEIASEFTLSFGATICYVDARETLGHMIELCPRHAIIEDRYRQARDAAAAWDGMHLFCPWAR